MKHEIIPIMAAVLCGLSFFATPAQAKYGGGTGEPNDPYLIFDANQMNAIGADSNDWDKHFKLMADIDLAGFTGTSFNMIGYYIDYRNKKPFSGVFDGNDHTIANFTYDSNDRNYIGLFGYVRGAIKNLGLLDPDVDAGTGDSVGSLVGYNNYGTVINCYTQGGNVSGSGRIGGLVGLNGGTVHLSFADCNVSGNADYVGGLAGYNYMGTILSCYSSGSVDTEANCVGGLTGYSGWIVSESYATGSVSGHENVGGLVGYNEMVIYSTPSGTIADCYAVGAVSGTNNVGGLVGNNDSGPVFSSFWDTQTTQQQTSDGGTPKTTAEMKNPNTFIDAGWDFVGEYENGPNDDWAEPVGGGYPVLSWQLGELLPLPAFSGGSGTPDEPYLISTPADLSRIGHNPRLMNAHFKLTNDVNMADTTHFIIGNGLYPFAGTFDGGGHVVSNFYRYARTGEMSKGLFGIVNGVEAEIKNLGLTDSGISGGGYQTVGLLVGLLKNGTVSGCFAERGSISVFESDGGGLVGANYGTISNCYANVSVSGWFGVGGLVEMNRGIISNCYSRGRVTGSLDFGGLVSRNSGTVTNSFWDIETSQKTVSAGGTGKTTVQMQTRSTFTNVGWDFSTPVWIIDEGMDYPRLWWEENHVPIADAGPDQTIYAWIDGIAEVTLDGTGSYDDDGQPLTYLWRWTIDGQTYDVNGVTPVIELPVGEQTIELIVNDGIDDSEPDEVIITVIEPVESQLRIAPRVINRHSRQPKILVLVRLPEGVTKDQIDSNEQLLLYPGGIEAIRQRVTESRRQGTSIFALFDKAELMDAVSDNGRVELRVGGLLKTGQYFYGSDTVLVIGNW